MLRAVLILLACAAAAVWIEPRWNETDRVLTLRVRRSEELVGFVRAQSRDLGRRAVDALREQLETPAVGSGPGDARDAAAPRTTASRGSVEGITRSEQSQLDQLVEETTREP